MKLTTILFDAGNTLVFIDPDVVLPIFRRYGAEVEPDRFWTAEFEARTRLSRVVEQGAKGTESHLWKDYFLDLFRGSGVPEQHLQAVGDEIREVHRESHIWSWIDPETAPALEALKEAGYRLAVISNADGRVEGLIEGAGIHHHFEFVMDSHLEGVEKPDPEIFRRAAERMGVDPGECLYVGDLYPVDVLGARAAGMEAVLLDPLERLDYPVDRISRVADLPEFLEGRMEGRGPN